MNEVINTAMESIDIISTIILLLVPIILIIELIWKRRAKIGKKFKSLYHNFICFMLIFFARRFQNMMNREDKANDGWVWVKDTYFDEIVLYAKNGYYTPVKEFVNHKLKRMD